MFNKIIVCTPTVNWNPKFKAFAKNVVQTIGCEHRIACIRNSGNIPMTKMYKDAFNFLKDEKDSIIVFSHDDLEYVTVGWGNKLLDLFNNNQDYGIIGLAGSTFYDGTRPWWTYDTKQYLLGQVIHRTEQKGLFMTAFSELLDEDVKECVVVDGLFMAVNPTKIEYEFDETLGGFHFYDIDFCLGNFLTHKCKIGVTTNIRVVHNSVGKPNEMFKHNQEVVNEKYKEFYPIEVAKQDKEEKKENNNEE